MHGTRKTTLAFIISSAGSFAFAQNEIYSNAGANPADTGLATGVTTASGVPAPAGFVWSEMQAQSGAANALSGFSVHPASTVGGFRLADDIVVAAVSGWRIDSIAFFAYQAGYDAPISPFTGINVRIWDGPPGDVQSAVVYGDDSTNRILSSDATSVLRTFTTLVGPLASPPDDSRRIWEVRANFGGVLLAPGTYWIDWQILPNSSEGEAFSPAITRLGERSAPGWNARRFVNDDGGAWAAVIDTGKPPIAADVAQDFPFIIRGAIFNAPCPGDLNGDQSVSLQDLSTLLAHFGTPSDATAGDGDLDADGDVDLSDLTQLLANFGTICN